MNKLKNMKKVVLHKDEDLREATNIRTDKYAMEISEEYMNQSKIQSVHSSKKLQDTNDKLK
ncbi:hypothetical protein [Bacillus mycoides]|uniref:hypothetical protein n=2 Tax=Bacillus mycoides TaxID=1405 RepID=UPI003D1F5E9D